MNQPTSDTIERVIQRLSREAFAMARIHSGLRALGVNQSDCQVNPLLSLYALLGVPGDLSHETRRLIHSRFLTWNGNPEGFVQDVRKILKGNP